MKKRVISLILALVLVIGLLPTVLADNNGPNQSQQQLQSVQDFTYEGQTYTLAMGHLEGSGAVHIFNQGSSIGTNFISNKTPGQFYPAHELVVSVFQNIDNKDLTERKDLISLITNVEFSIIGDCAKVDPAVAPKSPITEEQDAYWHAPMYYKCTNGEGILQAVITLTINGQSQTHTLQIRCHTIRVENTIIDCADPTTFPETYQGNSAVDTMEELNALIAGLQLSKNEDILTTVHLAPVIYKGILVLGNTTGNRNLWIEGTQIRQNGAECATAILGGIKVTAHGGMISNLYLQKSTTDAHNVKDSQNRSCGILTDGGEYSVVENCVFENYDIGLANQNGFICPRSFLVFRKCGIGVQITPNAKGNANSIIENNQFIGCDIGLQIDGLPSYISNYAFRVFNCDFVDSRNADITGGNKDGYYYCYGNFYGKTNETGELVFRNAKGPKARVLTNPRMKEPVAVSGNVIRWNLDALAPKQPVVLKLARKSVALSEENNPTLNYVTVEQSEETDITQDEIFIRNDLAEEYMITDPAFYARTKNLSVHVLDKEGQTMGHWRFPFSRMSTETLPADSPNFNACLDISEEKNAITVTVSSNGNDCLSALSPILTIPGNNTWTAASVTKGDVSVEGAKILENGDVSFPVTAPGTYTITATAVREQLMVGQVSMAPDGSFDTANQLFDEASLRMPYGTFFTVAAVGLDTKWLGDKERVTSSDTSVFTVKQEGVSNGRAVYLLQASGVGTANLEYNNGTEKLTLPVQVEAPGAADIPNNITVGFGSYMDPDETMLFLMTGDPKNNSHYKSSYNPYEAVEGYQPFRPIMVRAGIYSDSAHLYQEQTNVNLKVEKLWIEPLTGEDVFSWSPTEVQTELIPTGDLDRVQLYAKDAVGSARLWAEVRIDGSDWLTTISARAAMEKLTIVEQSFNKLKELGDYLANNEIKNGVVYRFTLGPGKHTGKLTLPENMMGKMIYISGADNGSTTIEGSIDLNGSGLTEISNICFKSPDGDNTKAIYNGSCMSVANCSFYNYDVALDGTSVGLVNPGTGNLFVNNTVAVSVDVKQVSSIAHVLCDLNTFINNETALKVLSLHEAVGPFRFRITNSNFINNGLDLDVDHPGTYYFYKNYFGAYDKDTGNPKPGKTDNGKNNGKNDLSLDKVLQARSLNSLEKLIATRPAKTDAADGVRIITNPRWAYPVAKWWHQTTLDEPAVFGENTLVNDFPVATLSEDEEYVNYLTSDWDGTEIVNAEADGLLMDAAAFSASDTKKTIDVVAVTETNGKTSTETLGTWSFE